MALRCERCRKSELTLESFGVYRCAGCGRVDADGNLLDAAAADTIALDDAELEPVSDEAKARATFAPAPEPAARASGPAPLASSGPTASTLALALAGLVCVAGQIAIGAPTRAVIQLASFGALVTGKPWAYKLASSVTGLVVGASLAPLVVPALIPQPDFVAPARVALGLVVAGNLVALALLARAQLAAR
jgi:hypothetical protein